MTDLGKNMAGSELPDPPHDDEAARLGEVMAWTNSEGKTFDPSLRDCLACNAYRDPYATECACGRRFPAILVRVDPPSPPPATSKGLGFAITAAVIIIVFKVIQLITG
jgi:hypothetical protein